MTDKKDVNYKSLFIGDKSENGDTYLNELTHLIHEHFGWRKNYLPGDLPAITDDDKLKEDYVASQENK
ncbi:hypothetical protein [Lactobacillus rodentium]|uniref:Uncharacterized protein n=1 Tax=Lactobacillus rodentium TaxID=947835 RepID=A0A2Z6T7H8_9LACO|nr:hypothetical protein [Lactobacillus rodentium]GBG05216.1 hypothetical protein LrDSM24759_11300 [Lactobacillus rodentium]